MPSPTSATGTTPATTAPPALLNGFGLYESLKVSLPRRRAAQPVAIALVGIDGFLDVVDSYGREAGDRLLEALADIIEVEIGGQVFAPLRPGRARRVGAPETTPPR